MRIAILSDIHSNLEALNAVLEYINDKNIEKIICLGDIVGYGASPNECIEVLLKLSPIFTVAGNHDFGVLGKTDIIYFNEIAQIAIKWTKKQLDCRSIDYLNSLPLTSVVDEAFIVHASPGSPDAWNYIFDIYDAKDQFQYFDDKICFVGHSHVPRAFVFRKKSSSVEIINEKKFSVSDADCRYLINVGSVGQPRDGDPRASFVIWDTD
ncbi:MAG: metallophosphoesterase family protein, partial [candidate division WOR-3 bacterium]|nr:metallophosphoesterase family protein [candidate division WOR-3 bacterium]